MARPLRIQFAGALYHVMSRGNERRDIVRDDQDRAKRLDWLQRTVETCGWRLHAFVLLDNHEHLFVETPEANLSAGMQLLNGSYTSYFNRRHRRSGHLFQGRFKGHLFEEEGYFLEVSRYIHLNPLRAKMVRRLEEYPWSSYVGYVQSRRALDWVCYTRVLGEFGGKRQRPRRAYAAFVRAGATELPVSPFAGAVEGLLLGSQRFVDRVRGMLEGRPATAEIPELKRLRARPSLERIMAAVADRFGCDVLQWTSGRRSEDVGRAVAAYLGRCVFGYRATAVAEALGYGGPSSVSHAIRRIEAGTKSLRSVVKQLEADLS